MTTANEIAEKIAAENDLTKAQAKTIVDSVFKAIADAAASGAETSLPGFGKFKVKDSPARGGPQSVNRRDYCDRSFQEADLYTRQSHQGCSERISGSWRRCIVNRKTRGLMPPSRLRAIRRAGG